MKRSMPRIHPRLRTFKAYDISYQARITGCGFAESAISRRKRIAFILPKVSYEGVTKVGLIQAGLLKTYHCHDVEVISLIKEKQRFEELLSNLNIRYTFPVTVASRGFYHVFAEFMKTTSNLMLAHNIPATVVANRFLKRNKIPYITYIHDAAFNKIPGSLPSFGHSRIKEALENSAIIFTNSFKTLQKLKKEYDVDGFPLHPGCFINERFDNRRSDFFLFVHFISPISSFTFLGDLLEREDFNLVIAGGRRWGWQKVFHAFQNLGNRVRFIFEPTENELSVLYQRAKGLIFPEVENFGLPPLEAAACGCPSIVANGSGVLEILDKEKEVLAFEEGDIKKFGEALQILKEDAEYAGDLGKRARAKAEKYSWDVHVSKLAHSIEAL